MPSIEIVPSEAKHVMQLAATLREADAREMTVLGLDPRKILWNSYRRSIMRKTAFVDGEIAAMWGVAGSPLGYTGQPYLVTGKAVLKISPIAFSRVYRRELAEMRKIFPVLENYVDATYNGAVRMLELAGFRLGDVMPLGPNNAPFRRFEART